MKEKHPNMRNEPQNFGPERRSRDHLLQPSTITATTMLSTQTFSGRNDADGGIGSDGVHTTFSLAARRRYALNPLLSHSLLVAALLLCSSSIANCTTVAQQAQRSRRTLPLGMDKQMFPPQNFDENAPICIVEREPCGFYSFSLDGKAPLKWIKSWCRCSSNHECAYERTDMRMRVYRHTCVPRGEIQEEELVGREEKRGEKTERELMAGEEVTTTPPHHHHHHHHTRHSRRSHRQRQIIRRLREIFAE